jgi:hypothetical protein
VDSWDYARYQWKLEVALEDFANNAETFRAEGLEVAEACSGKGFESGRFA